MYLTLNRASRVRPAHAAYNGAAAIDQLLEGFFHRAAPAEGNGASTVAARFDVVEKDDRFEARIEIPGVNKDDIDVQIDGASVRVKAEAKGTEAPAEGAKVLHSNRATRSWQRNFTLPSEVDEGRAEAAYQDGVLTLTLPKKEVVQPKRVAVK
jgi:HSP20 family protein